MRTVILYTENGHQEFDSFEKMFQTLSEQGEIIEAIEDGKISVKGKGELVFAIQTTEGTSDAFVAEVETYRSELRASITKLKNQGIEVSKPELQKLAKQFEFLSKPTEEKVDEVKQEETPSSE